jgi:HD superfamily phosphohydrolase
MELFNGKEEKLENTLDIEKTQNDFVGPKEALYLYELLKNPVVKDNLPIDFNYSEEATHIYKLIDDCPSLKDYIFEEFVFAGSSGNVFRVRRNTEDSFSTALKIARKKIYYDPKQPSFSEEELDALIELVHTNILRQYDFIEKEGKGTIAICSAYISNPQGIHKCVEMFLEKGQKTSDKFYQISPERLNDVCEKVIDWFYQIALALQYMHEKGFCHLDIKPENILMNKIGRNTYIPIITDMGSCKNINHLKQPRAHFTWAYVHPELSDTTSQPDSINKHGLRASADIKDPKRCPIYDLHALGKTIQQILAIIDNHFGEICFSNYYFRYMHIIAALLLDGRNIENASKKRDKILERHNIEFVSDFPMRFNASIFTEYKITSAKDLVERIKRHKRDYSISDLADEFGMRSPKIINNTIGEAVPFSKRVSNIFNHPAVKRLYDEPQLGLMTEIYPGASHNRWSHSIGVYSLVLKYYISLLSDPNNPLFKIIINKSDLDHVIIASILHDLGQTSLCHDLEGVNIELFDHISYIRNLIDDSFQTPKSLRDTINDKEIKLWGEIDFDRIISIISKKPFITIDHIASNSINGPIDTDKLDYIKRDSYYCGVSYGDGIDNNRIINSLTVNAREKNIQLAYNSKGRTAISSMLLARYQLYGAVYWHHTFRCLHAMLFYATQLAFGSNYTEIKINKNRKLTKDKLRELYYHRVICKRSWPNCWKLINMDYQYVNMSFAKEIDIVINNYTLDFIYRFTTEDGKILIKNILSRILFKRIFSKNLSGTDLSDLKEKCLNRVQISKAIQKNLLDLAKKSQFSMKRTETSAEITVSKDILSKEKSIDNELYILVDFPKKVEIQKDGWPVEIDDSSRKFQNHEGGNQDDSDVIRESSNQLLRQLACLRVYSEKSFYRIITRYLTPTQIADCVKITINVL